MTERLEFAEVATRQTLGSRRWKGIEALEVLRAQVGVKVAV